jgi:hypothetical protein
MGVVLNTVDRLVVGGEDMTAVRTGGSVVWTAEVPPEPGPLVALWTFEGATPSKDTISGRTLTLGPNVTPTTVGGVQALAAPASTGSATAPDGFLNRTGFTVAFWLWTPPTAETTRVAFLAGATTVAELYGGWRNLSGTIYDLNRVFVVTDTGSYNRIFQNTTSGAEIPAQVWRHVVGTYDGAALTLYTNGVQRNTGAKTGTVTDPDGFTIDVVAGSAVKNVGIWNRALTGAEVADLYAAGVN